MNYKEISLKVKDLTTKVGAFIQNEAQNFDIQTSAENKGSNELVSYVDKESEKMLVKGLEEILPEAGFITEEGTINKTNPNLTWIIDPLDGTTNFMHQLPIYAISVALKHNNEIVVGVVHELNKDECFHASKGNGAFCNQKKISISKATKISDSLVVTGFPYSMDDKADQYMKVIRDFQLSTHGVRRLGSAATDMAYVACGRLDGYFEFNIKIWDIAAGICILNESGGKTTDFHGDLDINKISGLECIAAGHIHSEMLSIIQRYW
ncbi:MAG: inositol monophosphatase family protein [Cytophagales bacterium]